MFLVDTMYLSNMSFLLHLLLMLKIGLFLLQVLEMLMAVVGIVLNLVVVSTVRNQEILQVKSLGTNCLPLSIYFTIYLSIIHLYVC